MNTKELLGKKRKLEEKKNKIMEDIFNKMKILKEAEIQINSMKEKIKKEAQQQTEKLSISINDEKKVYFQSLKDNQE